MDLSLGGSMDRGSVFSGRPKDSKKVQSEKKCFGVWSWSQLACWLSW